MDGFDPNINSNDEVGSNLDCLIIVSESIMGDSLKYSISHSSTTQKNKQAILKKKCLTFSPKKSERSFVPT